MSPRGIAVVGAGGWGTALSVLWARKGHRVTLWSHNPSRVHQLATRNANAEYLPGIQLPQSIAITGDLERCADADVIVFVTPSTALREIAARLKAIRGNGTAAFLSCTKGIEHGTGARMSQIVAELFPRRGIAVLSGPNLAIEVARGLPTATVLGCDNREQAQQLQEMLATERFRIYTSEEVAGIELGGALKNVFAIGAGISDGLGFGDNTKAALMTRALAELLRIGTAMGGKPETFYGLSGAGDLMATCFSPHSRNRRVGEALGRGEKLSDVTAAMHTVAEGIPTARSAFESARRLGVETPIIDEIYAILYQGKRPHDAMRALLQRDLKAERI